MNMEILKLDQIVGQPTAVKILKASLPPASPAHAYLFAGPEGVGKRTTAMSFARALMCEAGQGDACGVCRPCKKIAAGTHPDLTLLTPEAREKKVKVEIDIARIREVIRKIGYKPYEAHRKILIMDGADMMNMAAANAFLKTLEEPPGDTVIILTAVNTGKLPLTVMSRCQVVRFYPAPFEETVKFLSERLGLGEKEAKAAAALSKGSIGLAMSGELDEAKELRSIAFDALVNIDSKGTDEIYKLANEMDKSKDKSRVDRFLEMTVELIRDLMTVKIQGKYDKLINVDLAPGLEEAASGFSYRRLARAYSIAQEMISARRWNINPLLVVSLLSLELKENNDRTSR